MLPGLRLVLAAISATIVIVVLGFGLLVKLQVAHSGSAGLAPVEARFAGLAFAARADWSPVSTSRAMSLESLAPFAKGPPAGSYRNAGTNAAGVVQSSQQLPFGGAPPLETPVAEPAPVAVAFVAPDLNAQITAARAVPEVGLPEPSVALGSKVGMLRGDATMPPIDVAALSDPPAEIIPVLQAPPAAELREAGIPFVLAAAPAAPVPPPLTVATTPAAHAVMVAPTLVVPIPDSAMSGAVEAVATREPSLSDNTAMLPSPRPATAGLPSAVPLPAARPAKAAAPRRNATPRPAKKTTVRAPVRRVAPPAKPSPPPPSAASSNPFAALFGGSSRTGKAPN